MVTHRGGGILFAPYWDCSTSGFLTNLSMSLFDFSSHSLKELPQSDTDHSLAPEWQPLGHSVVIVVCGKWSQRRSGSRIRFCGVLSVLVWSGMVA